MDCSRNQLRPGFGGERKIIAPPRAFPPWQGDVWRVLGWDLPLSRLALDETLVLQTSLQLSYHQRTLVMFHRTARLLQHACKITLFTRPGCSLCDDAKGVLSKVWDQKPFHYSEINVLEDQNQKWKAVYEFDTPVVRKLFTLKNLRA